MLGPSTWREETEGDCPLRPLGSGQLGSSPRRANGREVPEVWPQGPHEVLPGEGGRHVTSGDRMGRSTCRRILGKDDPGDQRFDWPGGRARGAKLISRQSPPARPAAARTLARSKPAPALRRHSRGRRFAGLREAAGDCEPDCLQIFAHLDAAAAQR